MPLCSLQLVQDRSRVEDYLSQSLPYLKDAQVTLRETAVRFIGEPQPLGSLFWQPGPGPSCCTGSQVQPSGCQSPDCPTQGPGRRGLFLPLQALPTQVALVAALLSPIPPRVLSFPGVTLLRGRRVCSQTGRAGGRAAGNALGRGRSHRALCLGLAARHLRDRGEEKLPEIYNGN